MIVLLYHYESKELCFLTSLQQNKYHDVTYNEGEKANLILNDTILKITCRIISLLSCVIPEVMHH